MATDELASIKAYLEHTMSMLTDIEHNLKTMEMKAKMRAPRRMYVTKLAFDLYRVPMAYKSKDDIASVGEIIEFVEVLK